MRQSASKSNLRAQSALLAILLAVLFCGKGEAQLSPPTFIAFSPTQASAGSTVTFTFTGANFVSRSLNLMFSPAQGITVSGVRAVSSMQITAQVQVAASAQPGSRQVILLDADHNLHVSTFFTITAGAQNNCPPGMAATSCGSTPSSTPVLREFTPVLGAQGTTVAITFTGANFTAPASVQFTPNSGITVQSATVTNANQIQAQVVIAPNAALSARGVVLVVGNKQRLTATNTFTVVSSASSTHAPPMQILRVIPNQIAAGSQNVDLTLEGTNFVPGTQVTFTVGAGVPAAISANGPARYINSTEMHVSVNVLPSALPGGRDINLQPPGSQSRLPVLNNQPGQQAVIGKGMLSVMALKQSGPPALLKILPLSIQKFVQGVIHLDAPLGPGTQSDQYVTYTVPLLDDNSVFKWHEQNPGMADYYELRVYAKDGKTLLATQKIMGVKTLALGAPGGFINVVPTYYRPDPAFLKTVLEPTRRMVFSGAQLGGFGKQATVQQSPPSGGNANATAPPDQLNGQLSQGDLQWEVAGFHTYNKNGVTTQPQAKQTSSAVPMQNQSALQNTANAQNAGGTVDVPVELSDRWPLKAPLPPTGLACSGTGVTTGNLVAQNFSKNSSGTSTDPNNYMGDNWSLTGTIDLSRSPYQADYTPQTAVPAGATCGNQCLVKDVTQVQFSNVFVDWGDGTVVPLTAPPVSSTLTNWDPSQQLALPTNSTGPMQHAYQSTGGFTIRVYQLSDEDLQHTSVGSVSSSVDGPTTPFMQAALLSKMTSQGAVSRNGISMAGLQSSFQQILSQGSGSTPASQAASDAYMLVCQPIYITVLEDLVADGPLHLKGIGDPDFGAYDISQIKTPVLNHFPDGNNSENQILPKELHPSLEQTNSPPDLKKSPELEHRGMGPIPIAQTPTAICSTCDEGIDAITSLQYYGTGQVRVTWTVDGVQSQQTLSLPSSTHRKNLTRQGYTTIQFGGFAMPIPIPEPPIIVSTSKPIYSPGLQVQPLGNHSVTVEADVLPQPTMPNLSNAVGKALGSLMPMGLAPSTGASGSSGSGDKMPTGPSVAEAQSLLKTLAPPAGSNLPPLKVGLLSSSNQSVSGLGVVQYVNGPLQQVIGQLAGSVPDQHVASNAKLYEVVASDPKKPCMFLFPANNGEEFEITGLQNHVTQQGTTYNGTGNLVIHFANSGSEGYDEYPPIPVKIDNWSVPDGLHVQTGSINVSPNIVLEQDVPGLQGSIQQITAQKVGGELDATLNLSLSDDTLRQPGEMPVSWNGVMAELHANGDWIKDGLTLPTTLIGWSAFTMQSNSVRLDLSHHDGDAAGMLCGTFAKPADWVGVRFKSLAITPYTMDLVSGASLQPVVTDWGVVGDGLCGSLTTGPFTAHLGTGTVSFASINATAFSGTFNAQYNNMDIYVPWLDTHLKGSATLQSGGGKQSGFTLTFNNPQSVTKTFGNFSFTAANIQFIEQQNLGWVAQANTTFNFSAGGALFASFTHLFNFSMDGRCYFTQGAPSLDVSLGGSSHLGQTPVDLGSVHLTAPSSGPQVLAALFNISVHLSEVMSASTAQVNYSIDMNGANYTTNGPSFAPFTIDVPYPSGQPSADARIHPVYSGASGSGGSSGTEISGSVDLSELGGPPITGEFRLGYQGGHDYWLTRVSYALGPTGLPLISVPVPVMNLYRVQGGIGHNFPISAFEDTGSLKAEQPVMDNSFLFMAGIRVGMPDQFTYTLDGDLAIKAGGQDSGARMDFHAWLLKLADSGSGDFQGYMQYAGGNFDARLWGHLNLLGGIASVDMGNSAGNAAVDLHFGPSGPWHIDAGKQQGPRISGQLLDTTANMYVMLSDAGLAIGGGEGINLNIGDDSVASAYIRGDIDLGLAITPQPHISGDLSANVSAGVCVDGACVSAGVSAQIHAEALPLEMNASASIGLPWPLGSVSFSVHM
jgi:hypothetical protein